MLLRDEDLAGATGMGWVMQRVQLESGAKCSWERKLWGDLTNKGEVPLSQEQLAAQLSQAAERHLHSWAHAGYSWAPKSRTELWSCPGSLALQGLSLVLKSQGQASPS